MIIGLGGRRGLVNAGMLCYWPAIYVKLVVFVRVVEQPMTVIFLCIVVVNLPKNFIHRCFDLLLTILMHDLINKGQACLFMSCTPR